MIPLIDLSIEKKLLREIKTGVEKVIDSQSYILGKQLATFESKFAKIIGVRDAIGVANGTDALRLSLRALGIGRGDKVLTVAFTSPFTSVAIVEEGAIPVYCDVDELTWTIDAKDCERKIDKHVKAIMPVHIYGNPSNMEAIIKIAENYNLKVIEDACQAHMASISGKKVGTFGDAAAFSFYPTKNLGGMGDGGIVTTNNKTVSKLVRSLRHGGQTRRFWHEYNGINSRLDEIQAAILIQKLKTISNLGLMRAQIVKRYKSALKYLPITFQASLVNARSANHLFVIRTQWRDKLSYYLKKQGIETGIYYPYGVHQLPSFVAFSKGAKLVVTENLLKEVLALPLYPNLSQRDQDYIVKCIKKFYGYDR